MKRLTIISATAMCASFVAINARADERTVSTPAELVDALRDMSTNSAVRLITLREGVYDLTEITAMSANGLLDLSMKSYGKPVVQGDPAVTRDKVVLDAKESGRILNLPFGNSTADVITFRNLTFRNGKVTGSDSTGGAICAKNWGRVNVTNCAFYCNVAGKSGGAIGGTLGDLYCYDCLFETNKLSSGYGAGGAVGTCKGLYDCVFRKNTCANQGWGGAVSSKGSVKRCLFDSNTVTGSWGVDGGGALIIEGSGTIDGCTFTNNSFTGSLTGTGGGGALRLSSFTGKVLNCMFEANSVGASKYGGAIYGGSVGAVISNCTFRSNRADASGGSCRGGAIAKSNGQIEHCVFEENSASYGGGVWSCTNVCTSVFRGNRSIYNDGNNGGGAGFESSFYDCIITNNSSAWKCGGVYSCKVYGSYLADNSADNSATAQEAGDSYFECCQLAGRSDGAYFAACFLDCCFSRSVFNAFNVQYLLGNTVAATNCLFTDITASGICSVQGAEGATLVNCTLADNDYAQLFRFAPGFAAEAKAVAVNVLCYENRSAEGDWRRDDIGETDGQVPCLTNCCLSTVKAISGADNLNYCNNPTLSGQIRLMLDRDQDHPYAPRRRSVLNGAGLVQGWMAGAKDLAGQDRLTEGKVAIGAYETTDRGPFPGLILMVR